MGKEIVTLRIGKDLLHEIDMVTQKTGQNRTGFIINCIVKGLETNYFAIDKRLKELEKNQKNDCFII